MESDRNMTQSRFVKTDHHTLKKPFVSAWAMLCGLSMKVF
ncbi:hypothetical protein C4K02_1225 [Pseudomonas synxantha]|nr:hypothetical protein C4K02_1225 [Pseudomonas synxantha]